MAAVTLGHLWLHDADDLSDVLVLRLRGMSSTPERRAERREYAGGRFRLVRGPQTVSTLTVDLSQVTSVQVARLEGWTSRVLMLRDPAGRKMFGFFDQFDVEDVFGSGRSDVTFRFEQVTRNEQV